MFKGFYQNIHLIERATLHVAVIRHFGPMKCQNGDRFFTQVRKSGKCRDRANEGRENVLRESLRITLHRRGEFRPGLQQRRIALMTLDRCARSLCPEQHVGAPFYSRSIAPFFDQGSYNIGKDVGLVSEFFQLPNDTGRRCWNFAKRSGKRFEDFIQPFATHGQRSSIVRKRVQGLAHEHQRVPDSHRPLRIHQRTFDQLATRISDCDKVPGKVSTIYRRNVLRVQGTKVPSVIPIVEVAAETIETVHRCERCIQSFYRFVHAQPAEIICADRGEKVQSKICRRSPMGH